MSSETAAASRSGGRRCTVVTWRARRRARRRGAGADRTRRGPEHVRSRVARRGDELLVVEVAVDRRREDGPRPRRREHVCELAGPVVGQQRVDHRTGGEDADRDHRGVEPVRQLHRHDVAGADPLGRQEPGDPQCPVPQLGVGEVRAVVGDDRPRTRAFATHAIADPRRQRDAVPRARREVLRRARVGRHDVDERVHGSYRSAPARPMTSSVTAACGERRRGTGPRARRRRVAASPRSGRRSPR